MKNLILRLQLFAEGGDGSAAGTSGAELSGADSQAQGEIATPKGRKSNPLENVIYGKPSGDLANPNQETTTEVSTESKAQAFEKLIKGEYKDEFQKRTQGIIDNRFKETKHLQDTLKSHDFIMQMLGEKYGVDPSDIKGLTQAIDDDDSFYQQEAMEKGLTVKQLKELKRLERENAEFKKAHEEAQLREHTEQIYSDWMNQAAALKDKYGLANLDLRTEIQNPEFISLLKNGVSVESAYKAIHMDEMLGGAMAQTANAVRSKMANSIGQRNARPSENGVSAHTQATFKPDVNSLTKADRQEIMRRAARGETITL